MGQDPSFRNREGGAAAPPAGAPADAAAAGSCGSPHPALGIDFGEVRVGVAATDPCGILAHPVATLERRRGDVIAQLAGLAEARGVRTLVIGLPMRGDGSEGRTAAKVRAFAAALGARLPSLPVVFVDESFSTVTAAGRLREAGRKARRHMQVIDQAAAVEILNAWLATLPEAKPAEAS